MLALVPSIIVYNARRTPIQKLAHTITLLSLSINLHTQTSFDITTARKPKSASSRCRSLSGYSRQIPQFKCLQILFSTLPNMLARQRRRVYLSVTATYGITHLFIVPIVPVARYGGNIQKWHASATTCDGRTDHVYHVYLTVCHMACCILREAPMMSIFNFSVLASASSS